MQQMDSGNARRHFSPKLGSIASDDGRRQFSPKFGSIDPDNVRRQFSPRFGSAIELVLWNPFGSIDQACHRDQSPFADSDTETLREEFSIKAFFEDLHFWWESRVSVIIPQGTDIRDHFALERTFLGHLRTSLALASCSVIISQCFTLSLGADDPMAPDEVRFRQIGKPLSCALLLWAMITAILGAIRFMRMQDALIHEEAVIEGGWELHAEGIGIFLILCFMMIATLVAES